MPGIKGYQSLVRHHQERIAIVVVDAPVLLQGMVLLVACFVVVSADLQLSLLCHPTRVRAFMLSLNVYGTRVLEPAPGAVAGKYVIGVVCSFRWPPGSNNTRENDYHKSPGTNPYHLHSLPHCIN